VTVAKKKRSRKGAASQMAMPMPSRNRVSVAIEEADNGFVVNTSSSGKKGYEDKTLIAPHGRAALRIATGHMQHLAGTKLKKKTGGKKASIKKSAA